MLTGAVPFTGETPVEIAMKHLSTVPSPPSELNSKVPHDLDAIVLRALAKDPEDRYQSSEEMDADLGRVARGVAVSDETEAAATMVLAGAGIAAPTTVLPGRPPVPPPVSAPPPYAPAEPYYDYDEPARRRPIWPWLLALALVVSAGAAGWYVWTQIQNQLNTSKPVTVPLVLNLKQNNAVAQIKGVGLTPKLQFKASLAIGKGFVISQDPTAGNRTAKGNQVTLVVSNGRPKTTVPDVKTQSLADALAALTQAHLKVNVVEINSDALANTVTATAPPGGAVVVWNTKVRVNVSKGPKPVPIPTDVIGQPYANVLSELQGAGFAVKRQDVDSTQPKDTVVGTSPSPGQGAPPGSTVTVTVSKGPKTSAVPDVTSYSQADAETTLSAAGFKVAVQTSPTTDPTLDGVVISQSPPGSTQAKPGVKVTIVVGVLTAPPPTTTDTTTTDTTTTTTP